jgi:hypothetical protein
MGRMVRKQVYMDDALDHELGQAADRLGVSQAELVRRALEQYLVGASTAGESLAMRQLKEHWAEVDRLGYGGYGKWDREELHERGRGRH